MSLQRVSGTFDHVQGTGTNAGRDLGYVILDRIGGGPGWTAGATAVEQIAIQPHLTEKWRVLGWTIGVIGQSIVSGSAANPGYGRFGTLWAGLLIDTLLPAGAGGQLPQDLSTFAKLWDGSSDAAFPQAGLGQNFPNPERFLLVSTRAPLGLTFMLPEPLAVQPGQQFQMALVLTPSLIAAAGIGIADGIFSVIYDDGK